MQRVSTSFYQRNKEADKQVPINCRITFLGRRLDISTGIKISPNLFDSSKGIVKGKSIQAFQANTRIDQFRNQINGILIRYDQDGKELTFDMLKNELTGKSLQANSLFSAFRMFCKNISKKIGKGYADATLEKYLLTMRHLESFVANKYSTTEFGLNELNYTFISGFEGYLLANKNGSVSSVNKHTQRLKAIIKFAIQNEWIEKDPFIRHSPLKEKSNEIVFLDTEELAIVESKEFPIERLGRIRDFFIFCCYTGLAFQEVLNLSTENITRDFEGDLQITYRRQKTGKNIVVPLLPKAIEILEKYKADPGTSGTNKILPVPSNVKFNAYLKEIADICGINKNLTVHVARKTFATTVLLTNDVPIETVSELLGHYSIKLTQKVYGKIVNRKVKEDMTRLKRRLETS
ncbi:MAG: site-specific integrase [Cyclobacteriaceae bacterium]|nr:site-specific integrase [Cyclobacteriaceae bacterium]